MNQAKVHRESEQRWGDRKQGGQTNGLDDVQATGFAGCPDAHDYDACGDNNRSDVQKEPYEEGLHIPVNPFYEWYFYDVRQKSHLEEANVPSQDQLQTKIQVSVQFRLINDSAPKILQETGQSSDVLRVHIVPKLRSLLREQGKAIKRAEDFFSEQTQQNMQISLLEGLTDYLGPKGVKVSAVLIRDISLPPFIIKAIGQRKSVNRKSKNKKRN